MNAGWARDPIRAAGGRRHYHALRQEQAMERQGQIAHYLVTTGTSVIPRGAQRKLAVLFEVSEATMSRDLRAIFGTPSKARPHCPHCGSSPFNAEGLDAVTNGLPNSPLRDAV